MSISNRLSRLAASICVLAAVTALSITPSFAGSPTEQGQSAERPAIVAHLEESGVPATLQEGLIDKVESGQPLDSELPTSAPLYESVTVRDGFKVVRKDYADGSFVESSVEIGEQVDSPAPGVVAPYAIKGCSSTGGTGYRQMSNCLVYVNAVTYSANFRATWVYGANGVGTISKVWDSSLQVYLGSFSNKTMSVTKKASSSSGPAQARLKWRYTAVGGVAQGDSAIYLNVSKNSAWTTTN